MKLRTNGLARAMAISIAAMFMLSSTTVLLSTNGSAYVPPEGIAGTVTDAVTGDPLVGAYVTGGGTSAYTSSTGSYWLTINVGGAHTVTVSKTGFNTQSQSVSISSRTGYGIGNFAMTHQNGIYGRVRSAETGNELIAGATVNRYVWENEWITYWADIGTSDANGFYYVPPVTQWGTGNYDEDLLIEKPGTLSGTTPIAGYWGHHVEVTTNCNSVVQYNVYLRRATVADVITSGVLVNMTLVNNSAVSAINCQYLLTSSSTTSFGMSGNTILGLGASCSYTYQQGSGIPANTLSSSTGNAIFTKLTVECTGITEGIWGSNYHEENRHVGQVFLEGSLLGWYKDPVRSDDSRYGSTLYYTNNAGARKWASESSMTVTSADFKVSYSSHGVTGTFSASTSVSSSATATIEATPKTSDSSHYIYFKYFFETSQSGKGIFLHLCYYSYS